MTTENLNQEVDVFNMSDEEFAAWEQGSSVQSTEESTYVDSSDFETEEQETYVEDSEEEHEEEYTEDDDSDFESDPVEESDEELPTESTEESESDAFDYKTGFEKLIGTPIKANGKEITVDSVDDAIRLMQMGMGYSSKMAELKPAQRLIAMLENNDFMDEDKLNYAIDLIVKRDPKAINKLVAEAGIDKYDLDEETATDYTPNDYRVSDQNLAVDNALKDISSTPTYSRTLNVIGKEWDSASRDIIKRNPQVIGLLNSQIASGMFDTVQQEVEKRRMFGTLPEGMSNLEAYKLVGDSLYAMQPNLGTPQGQFQEQVQATVSKPIQKPNRETVVRQKKAASAPRGKTSVSKQMVDVFNMSDDDFLKRYSGINN